jgi:glycosyltransferase involved in cell wall biosynthesis
MTVVAFDARALGPNTRHWGVGVVIDNIIARLERKICFRGITNRFSGAVDQGFRTWPTVRKTGPVLFEVSSLLAGSFDLYWGTNHFVPASCKRPAVVTVHDLLLFKYPEDQPHSRFLAGRLASSVKRAKCVLTDSRTTADELIALFPYVRPKVEVALLGFERSSHISSPDGLENYVVMVGAHHPRKNLPFAVAVADALTKSGVHLPLLVTGDIHPCFGDVVRANSSVVQTTGVVSKQQVFGLLKGARAMLFPSRYEGFGFPLLEAMNVGCPVLALDIPINREIAGDAAWLLPPDEKAWVQALRQLTNSDSLRREMSQRGAENLKRFSWDRTAELYEHAFTSF